MPLSEAWATLAREAGATIKRTAVHALVRELALDVKLSGRSRSVDAVLDDLCQVLEIDGAELVKRIAARDSAATRLTGPRKLSLDDEDSLDGQSEVDTQDLVATEPKPRPAKRPRPGYQLCGYVHEGYSCNIQLAKGAVR